MEGKVLGVSRGGAPGDADDFDYICGLSTILVATVQEVKDRVSQIEFIFCSQLFPNLQVKSRLAEARKTAEEEWKKEEAGLMSQIEKLRSERRDAEEKLQRLSSSLEETKAKLVSAERLVTDGELEKKQLLGRLEGQTRKEETICRLERELEQKTAEVSKEKELQQRLRGQIELKDTELILEQNKRKDLIEDYTQLKTNYKHLKSQYTFLIGKIDTSALSSPPLDTARDEKSFQILTNKRKLDDAGETNKASIQVISEIREPNSRPASCAKARTNQDVSSVRSPFRSSRLALASPPTILPPKNAATASHLRPETSSGITRPSSHWRETRAHREPGAVDPHDDFLDTPMEAAKNMIRNPPEQAQALAAPPQDMDFNDSDDETQDISIATQGPKNKLVCKQQNISPMQPSDKSFKFVEPVRKKADRENLKGLECKQCKMFYDAVLPNDHRNGDGTNPSSLRCEHHDGVSKHRYRYAPPMTPEGFWNIGFESEM